MHWNPFISYSPVIISIRKWEPSSSFRYGVELAVSRGFIRLTKSLVEGRDLVLDVGRAGTLQRRHVETHGED